MVLHIMRPVQLRPHQMYQMMHQINAGQRKPSLRHSAITQVPPQVFFVPFRRKGVGINGGDYECEVHTVKITLTERVGVCPQRCLSSTAQPFKKSYRVKSYHGGWADQDPALHQLSHSAFPIPPGGAHGAHASPRSQTLPPPQPSRETPLQTYFRSQSRSG